MRTSPLRIAGRVRTFLSLSLVALGVQACGDDRLRPQRLEDPAVEPITEEALPPEVVPPANLCEGFSNSLNLDTDGDGHVDWLETALGTDPANAQSLPGANGELVFLAPYSQQANPPARQFESESRLARTDVVVLMDTTGSMTNSAKQMEPQFPKLSERLRAVVPDIAMGLAGFGDFPSSGNNGDNDVPFYLIHRVLTMRGDAGVKSLRNTMLVKQEEWPVLGPWYAMMAGGSLPERLWEGVRQASDGSGIRFPREDHGWFSGGGWVWWEVPKFSPERSYPAQVPAGEEAGSIGGMGFRANALPIIIAITDAAGDEAPYRGTYGDLRTEPVTANRNVALDAAKRIGARVVGISLDYQGNRAATNDLTWLANQSDARVTPASWGDASSRPANCPVDRCCTRSSTSREWPMPDATGMCPLVFQPDSARDDLSNSIASAVLSLAKGANYELTASIEDNGEDAVNVVSAFDAKAGMQLASEGGCPGGSTLVDFPTQLGGINASRKVCLRMTAGVNGTVQSADAPQVFAATLRMRGNAVTNLIERPVRFVVPPVCKQ